MQKYVNSAVVDYGRNEIMSMTKRVISSFLMMGKKWSTDMCR
jgi:hypothetical protein